MKKDVRRPAQRTIMIGHLKERRAWRRQESAIEEDKDSGGVVSRVGYTMMASKVLVVAGHTVKTTINNVDYVRMR